MSIINDAIFIAHMNNYTSNSNFGLKISGKGLYDYYNFDNIYNSNGIAFQLISNLDDNREIAFVDTSNSNNPSLNFNFQPSQISINSLGTINFNSNLFITSNKFIGIGTNNPQTFLHLHSSNEETSLMITNDFPNSFTISKLNSHINISNSNGFIGIGTTNPQNFLDIRGDVILPYSRLGIGTTNPQSNLDVIGNCLITSNLNISNLILNGKIFNGDGTPFLNSQWSNIYDFQNNSSNITFNSGKVGIGTTEPRDLLDVSGRIACLDINIGGAILTKAIIEGTGTSADIINTGILKIAFGGTGRNSFNSNQLLIGNGTSPLLQTPNLIWSNNSLLIDGDVEISSNILINSNVLINSNGKIGIGTTNPETSIHIQSGINETAIIRIGDIYLNKSNQDFIISNSLPYGKIILGNITNNSNGFVGIGTTNPQSNLDVVGNVGIIGFLDMNNSNISNANIINTKILNISNIIMDNNGTFLKKDGTQFYASRWTSNGNNIYFNSGFVGIGSTIPQTPLDVIGNVGIKGFLDMKNSNISNANIINSKTLNVGNIIVENSGTIIRKDGTPFYASRWSSNGNNIYYNSGFIGIGTTNPQTPLDVNGKVSIKGTLNMNNSNISNAIFINSKTLNISNIVLENSGLITRQDGTLIASSQWNTSPLNPNNIYYTLGNVGIGTTNPKSTLDIVGDINFTGNIKYNNSNIFVFSSNIDTTPFASSLISNNSNYINLIGNVSIGSTTTNSNLFIYGNTYLNGTHFIQPDSNSGTAMVFYFNSNIIPQNVNNNYDINFKLASISDNITNPFLSVYNRFQTASSYNSAVKIEGSGGTSILIDGGASEGIGKISFSTNNFEVMNLNSNMVNISNCLDITGNSGTILNAGGAYITSAIGGTFLSGYSNDNVVFSLRTTDNIICGKNSYALSDRRIKKDILDINDNDALMKIMKIEPKTYNYIDTIQRTSSNVYGFIAQQIREVIPEAVEIISKFIPNVYKLVSINKNKFILDNHFDLNIDDILQIYTLKSVEEVKIIQINPLFNSLSNSLINFNDNVNDISLINSNDNVNDISFNSLSNSNDISLINSNDNVNDISFNSLINSNDISLSNSLSNSNDNVNDISLTNSLSNSLINSNDNVNDISLINSNSLNISIKYEITIDKEIDENQIFVYGKFVKDFHILDKSYLYTLNICATQQIYKDICKLTSNLDYVIR